MAPNITTIALTMVASDVGVFRQDVVEELGVGLGGNQADDCLHLALRPLVVCALEPPLLVRPGRVDEHDVP